MPKVKKTSEKDNKVRVQGYIPVEAGQKIDDLVKKIPHMNKTQLVSNLVMMGLDDAKMLDNTGLIKAAELGRVLILSITKAFKNVSLEGK